MSWTKRCAISSRSPLSAFLDAARREGLGERLVHCPPGATTTVSAAPHPAP
ncbi:hypothetical protein [Streptomyces sp. WAC08241]|uniref:hypothetical protein n=1 Tax=Streptomyces sp. WAC08241 TaxID=2487421 RepID=UPI00163D3A33|nr:hypothetical protein [Streptomyces sp. WAC08241]